MPGKPGYEFMPSANDRLIMFKHNADDDNDEKLCGGKNSGSTWKRRFDSRPSPRSEEEKLSFSCCLFLPPSLYKSYLHNGDFCNPLFVAPRQKEDARKRGKNLWRWPSQRMTDTYLWKELGLRDGEWWKTDYRLLREGGICMKFGTTSLYPILIH